jgi:two-component sensor histidine kinase
MNAGLDPDRRRVEADVEPIAVAAAMAAPLALLIHELTANALQHAFPDEREGRVSIAARRTEAGMHLTIRDDGIGLAAAPPNPAGFGRNLVEMVVRQMRGTITWTDGGPGTTVEIDIPLRASS